MSSTSAPISAHQFAEAIKDLPLTNLHSKAAEIRNSMAHLISSNHQLQSFADGGDTDCKEAIQENIVVMQRLEGRIQMLKQEVEGRGFKWAEDEQKKSNVGMNGNGIASGHPETMSAGPSRVGQGARSTGGSLDDEELIRRIRERMGEDEEIQEDGVHL